MAAVGSGEPGTGCRTCTRTSPPCCTSGPGSGDASPVTRTGTWSQRLTAGSPSSGDAAGGLMNFPSSSWSGSRQRKCSGSCTCRRRTGRTLLLHCLNPGSWRRAACGAQRSSGRVPSGLGSITSSCLSLFGDQSLCDAVGSRCKRDSRSDSTWTGYVVVLLLLPSCCRSGNSGLGSETRFDYCPRSRAAGEAADGGPGILAVIAGTWQSWKRRLVPE